jgi:hypothetical protein
MSEIGLPVELSELLLEFAMEELDKGAPRENILDKIEDLLGGAAKQERQENALDFYEGN